MVDNAASQLLEALSSCRCCLRRKPDKIMNKPYIYRGQTEIYLDMLRECFDVHLTADSHESRICDVCVSYLRIASDFKMQVKNCQMELRERLQKTLLLLEEDANVKSESEDYGTKKDLSDEEPAVLKDVFQSEGTNIENMLCEDTEINQDLVDEDEKGAKMSLKWYGTDGTRVVIAQNVSARAKQQLVMSSSVRLSRLRNYEVPHTCNTSLHQGSLTDTGKTHTDSETYTCETCGEQYGIENSLNEHVQKHTTKTYGCKICSKDFFCQSLLNTHTCSSAAYVCDICSRKFKTKYVLIKHMGTHTGQNQMYTNKVKVKENIEKGIKSYRCKICNRLCVSLSCLKTHMRVHTGEKPYACYVCNKKFSQNSALKVHYSIHTGEKPFACTVCNMKFRLKSNMEQHMRATCMRTIEAAFSCDICSKKFKNKYVLTKHMTTHTGQNQQYTDKAKLKEHIERGKKSYRCKICNRLCRSVSCLKTHMRVHTGEKPYACDVCDKNFSQRSSRNLHYSVHTGEKPFACTVCNMKFRLKSIMEQHLRVKCMRTIEAAYSCDICNKKFKNKYVLIKHLASHSGQNQQSIDKAKLKEHIERGKKSYRCKICNRLCRSVSCLKTHMRVHTGEKPYACDVCNKKFSQRSSRNLHYSVHTGEKPFACTVCNKKFRLKSIMEQHMRVKCMRTIEAAYSCDICSKKFKNKYVLIKHMATHSGQKQQSVNKPKLEQHVGINGNNESYSCEICNKSCKKLSYLRIHMRVHTGEKPHPCDVCNKKFSQRSALNVHYSIHTGEKPYTCNICNKKCRVKGSLVSHMNHRHR